MEGLGRCKKCGKRSLVYDSESSLVCSSCFFTHESGSLEAQIGGINGPQGTNVKVGTSGAGSVLNYKDKKIYEAKKIVDEIMYGLQLSGTKPAEVKQMIEKITEGEYGQGDWFPVLVGACAYVVMRNDHKPLPIAEVVPVIGCDIYELGRMVNRVVDFLNLHLPVLDTVNSFDRALRNSPSFTRVERDKVEAMRKQGIFLMQCAVKWYLTTGRRPLPMIAAVLVFVAQLNRVDVRIEDVAKEVNATVVTSKLRYKELREALVKVGKALPWGKDITTKNILKNAPFVIQYMEIKSRSNPREKRASLEEVGFCFEEVVSDCLNKKSYYDAVSFGAVNDSVPYMGNDSVCFETELGGGLSNSRSVFDNMEQLNVSHVSGLESYVKFLNEASQVEDRGHYGGNQEDGCELIAFDHWWIGESEMCKTLVLKQILEKDVGLDPAPPSFVNGLLAEKRRREKIAAAKLRISKVMNPPKNDSSNAGDVRILECGNATGRKRKGRGFGIDWEDTIIETLLLHQVKEEEIVNGNYKALLGLHVFNSAV